ncbi:MAG TPA: amidohydrolase family protein [Candidatus Limnocylindrales bacterium]|nr:amidohydrolase family protein [Candidatus Limnocylindrales bacterium]
MHLHSGPISRRSLLRWGAVASAAGLAACASPIPSLTPRPSPTPPPTSTGDPSVVPTASPQQTADPTPAARPATGRVLYRDGALADGREPTLRRNVSILVEDGRIAWIRPTDGEDDPGGASVIDCAGATFVPGMVDCHSHVTGTGGANWIERFNDPPEALVATAEHNGQIGLAAGVRWMRDVGSPIGVDPHDGRERAIALGVRDRWVGRADRPYLRAAGSWLFKRGVNPMRSAVEAETGDELLAAAVGQLDDGADLIKLYMDGPDVDTSPWTASEVGRVVDAAHDRGARVAAHAGRLNGAQAAVGGGVDSIEHGFDLDPDVAGEMARRGTTLVSTLAVMRSWLSFGDTTTLERFASDTGRAAIEARLEQAVASVRIARDAGVAIATGSDFGGGSLRANQLAWEVTSLVAAGLEPLDALAAATWRGGQLIGEPEAGVIAEGGPADFFLVHGDPLSDPEALWRVWRAAW